MLERVGVTVEMPWAQTCSGQMHVNTGYPREAIPLVRNHVAAFEGYEAIVVPSGSCTAAIRHQDANVARLAGDHALAAAAEGIAARTWELLDFWSTCWARFQTAREAAVTIVELLLPFLAAQFDLLGVEHDYVVAVVDVRRPRRLVLAGKGARDATASVPRRSPAASTTYQSCFVSEVFCW